MRQLESWASRGLSFTLSAVIVVAGEGTGWARTLRVPGEFNTINKALSASVSGDTVLVAPGTYYYRLDTGDTAKHCKITFLK